MIFGTRVWCAKDVLWKSFTYVSTRLVPVYMNFLRTLSKEKIQKRFVRFVDFCLDPKIPDLQIIKNSDMNFLNFSECLKLPKTLKKLLKPALCRGTPARFLKNDRKHLSKILRGSGFLIFWDCHKTLKNFEKLLCAGEPLPDFPKMPETLARISQFDQSKVSFRSEFKFPPPLEKARTVRQTVLVPTYL